eukprot:jgi/Mesvir1/16470/Mv25189-RA.1
MIVAQTGPPLLPSRATRHAGRWQPLAALLYAGTYCGQRPPRPRMPSPRGCGRWKPIAEQKNARTSTALAANAEWCWVASASSQGRQQLLLRKSSGASSLPNWSSKVK